MYTKALVIKPEGTDPLENLHTKMGFKDIQLGRVDWTNLTQDNMPKTWLLLAHQGKEFLQQLSYF